MGCYDDTTTDFKSQLRQNIYKLLYIPFSETYGDDAIWSLATLKCSVRVYKIIFSTTGILGT